MAVDLRGRSTHMDAWRTATAARWIGRFIGALWWVALLVLYLGPPVLLLLLFAMRSIVRPLMIPAESMSTILLTAAGALAARAVRDVLDKAFAMSRGRAFFRRNHLERLLRDSYGAGFHLLQESEQLQFSGRVALGLDAVR